MLAIMEKMKLSESEKASVKIGARTSMSSVRRDPQAVVKVFADRPIRVEVLEATLGKIWCPIKGVDCKDLGGNRFLISFLQGSGKKRALEDGPWMVGRDLVVVVDFDGAKRIDEVEFSSIPIWVRVAKLPLGLMSREAGEMIGDVVAVDADEDGTAFGEVLRIKIRIDIRNPVMRGVTIDVGEGEDVKSLWCHLCYEFLPDFCYIGGIIGHTDRFCEKKLEKGEKQQYNRAFGIFRRRSFHLEVVEVDRGTKIFSRDENQGVEGVVVGAGGVEAVGAQGEVM